MQGTRQGAAGTLLAQGRLIALLALARIAVTPATAAALHPPRIQAALRGALALARGALEALLAEALATVTASPPCKTSRASRLISLPAQGPGHQELLPPLTVPRGPAATCSAALVPACPLLQLCMSKGLGPTGPAAPLPAWASTSRPDWDPIPRPSPTGPPMT